MNLSNKYFFVSIFYFQNLHFQMSSRNSMSEKKRPRTSRHSFICETQIVEDKYVLNLPSLMKNQEWQIYSGSEVSRKNQVIAFIREKMDQIIKSNEKKNTKKRNSRQRDSSIYFPSFCCKEIYKSISNFNGKPSQILIFEKIGISLFDILKSFQKLTSDILLLMVLLFIKFLKKVHQNSLNIVSLSFKNLFLVWQSIETPRLFLCNTNSLKLNLQSQVILNNAQVNAEQEMHSTRTRRSGIGKPNTFNSPRKNSRVSINKMKTTKRTDVQLILTKLTEIENDYHVFYEDKKEEEYFGKIIKYISSENIENRFEGNQKYDSWIHEIQKNVGKWGIDLSKANQRLFQHIKNLKKNNDKSLFWNPQYQKSEERRQAMQELSQFTQQEGCDEDYNCDLMSEKVFCFEENLKQHTFLAFQKKQSNNH